MPCLAHSGHQKKFLNYSLTALSIESKNEEVNKEMNATPVKSAFLQRRKGETFCTERLSEQQAKPSWLFFPVLWYLSICDCLWFAPCSARASATLAWFQLHSIVPGTVGCHLACRSSPSKIDAPAQKEMALASSPKHADPVIPLTGANSTSLRF